MEPGSWAILVEMPRGSWRIGPLAAAAVLATLLAPPRAAAIGFGSFTATGSMGTQRSGAVAAPLPDGQVLIAGGNNGSLDPKTEELASAELFDPATGSFSASGIGSMTKPRKRAAAAPLPDGRVLIAGGQRTEGNEVRELSSAEIFDPASNSFSSVSSPGILPTGLMTHARAEPVAAPLPNGQVLIAGGGGVTEGPGFEECCALSSAELFNPPTKTFSAAGLGSMTTSRMAAAAAPLPDGRVLIAGGFDNSFHALSSAEVFDPATKSFSAAGIGSMGTARADAVAAPLPDGRVLIAGGWTLIPSTSWFSSAEVFDPATNSFSSLGIGSMGTVRAFAAAAPLPDGRVLVTGGSAPGSVLSSAEIYGASNIFYTLVKGLKLLIKVPAFGQVNVSDAAAKAGASASKRRRRRILLKPSKVSGGPGTIVIRLRLTRLAKRALGRKGRVRVRARITFAPQGGLANTRTVRLKLKAKRRKSHRGP
jgi:hypothetical protein